MDQITIITIFTFVFIVIAGIGIEITVYKYGSKYEVFYRRWDTITKKFSDSSYPNDRFWRLKSARQQMAKQRKMYNLLNTGIKNRKTGEIIEHPENRLRDKLLEIWSSNPYADQDLIELYTHAGPREEFESIPEVEVETSKKNHESS